MSERPTAANTRISSGNITWNDASGNQRQIDPDPVKSLLRKGTFGKWIKIGDVTARLSKYSPPYQASPNDFVGQLRPQVYYNPKTAQLGPYTPNIEEVAPMSWRPGITNGRRRPWYQRPNYSACGGLGLKALPAVLDGISGYINYQNYRENMPDSTAIEALGYAVMHEAMSAGMNYGAIAALGTPMGLAIGFTFNALMPEPCFDPVLNNQYLKKITKIPVNINNISAAQMMSAEGARLALSIRDQAEAINKDVYGGRRSLLEMIGDSIITDPVLSNQIAQNIVTNPPAHPNPKKPWEVTPSQLEAYHKALQAHSEQMTYLATFQQSPLDSIPFVTADSLFPGDLPLMPSREDDKAGGRPFDDMPSLVDEPLPYSSAHMSKEDELVLGIDQIIADSGNLYGGRENNPSSLARLEELGIKVTKKEWGMTTLHSDSFSGNGLSPQLKKIVDGNALNPAPSSFLSMTRSSSNNSSRRKASVTPQRLEFNNGLVRDLKLIATRDGVGIQGKIGKNDGTISIVGKIGGSGGAICIAIQIPLTWMTLGISAAVLASLIGTQSLINRHIRNVNNKINKAFSHSNADSAFIESSSNNLVDQLNQVEKKDLGELLDKTNGLIRHISEKIRKELQRAEEARKLKKPDAANHHNELAQSYQKTLNKLKAPKQDLGLQKLSNQFIDKHKEKSSSELTSLLGHYDSKKTYTSMDVAHIHGLRLLVVNKVFALVAQGKMSEAQKLLDKSRDVTYFHPGTINAFSFGSGMGDIDGNTDRDIARVNRVVNELNQDISSGKDPSIKMQALLHHIETAEDIIKNMKDRKGDRHDINKKDDDYVCCKQWDARILAFKKYTQYLKDQAVAFENGSNAVSLEFDSIGNTLHDLITNQDKGVDFFIERIGKIRSDEQGAFSDEDLLDREYSLSKILGEIQNKVIQDGDFIEACSLVKRLGEESKEDADFAKAYEQSLHQLELNHNKGSEYFIQYIKDNKNDLNVPSDRASTESLALAHQFVMKSIFTEVNGCNFENAKAICESYSKLGNYEAEISQGYLEGLQAGLDNAGQDHTFFIAQLKKNQKAAVGDTENTDIDPKTTMDNAVASARVTQAAISQSDIGYHRDSAKIFRELAKSLPLGQRLQYQDSAKLQDFHFHGQVLGAAVRPVQEIFARHVNAMKKSDAKARAETALFGLNAAQILVPNVVPLSMQGIRHSMQGIRHYNLSKMATFKKSMGTIKDELKTDLCRPYARFSGAMIYSQFALLAIQHGPLENAFKRLGVEKPRELARTWRENASFAGGVGLPVAYAGHAAKTLWTKGLGIAYAPTLAVAIAQGALTVGTHYYQNHYLSEGEAVESPNHYRVEQGASSTLNGVGSTLFIVWATGGWGLIPLGIAALAAANVAHSTASVDGIKTATEKALSGAIKNINDFSLLKRMIRYVLNTPCKKVEGLPSAAELKSVSDGQIILLSDEDNHQYLYSLDFKKQESKKTKVDSNARFITDHEVGLLSNPASLKTAKNILWQHILLEHHWIKTYTGQLCYYIQKSAPSHVAIGQIKQRKRVSLCREANGDYLYFCDKHGSLRALKVDLDLPISDLLGECLTLEITDDSPHYQSLIECVIFAMVENYRSDSRANIKKMLDDLFNGLQYDSTDPEAVNMARAIHFNNEVQDKFEAKEYKEVIQLTERHGNDDLVNGTYRIAAHLVWQSLGTYRFLSYLEMPDKRLEFRDQYELYARMISQSIPQDLRQDYWPSILERFKSTISHYLTMLVVCADEAQDGDEKVRYLDQVLQDFSYVGHWYTLLEPEYIYEAALMCDRLRKNRRREIFTAKANPRYMRFLGRDDSGTVSSKEEHVWRLIRNKNYAQALKSLQVVSHFPTKPLALLHAKFYALGGDVVLPVLKSLLENPIETDDRYWDLMLSIFTSCKDSVKYTPNYLSRLEVTAKLSLLQRMCVDKIENIDPSHELMQFAKLLRYRSDIEIHMFHETLPEGSPSVSDMMSEVHAHFRDERLENIYDLIIDLLSNYTITCDAEDDLRVFLPVEVNPDGDCAFHVFGITRKEGMDELISAVQNPHWAARPFFGENPHQRNDVINIVLDDIEAKENVQIERGQQHFDANAKMAKEYLEQFKRPHEWMPYNQKGRSVLDALALLYSKNLRIYLFDQNGRLQVASENIHNPDFDTIEMLHTSADGFCENQMRANHYIKLVPFESPFHLVPDTQPIVEDNQFGLRRRRNASVEESYSPRFPGSAKPRRIALSFARASIKCPSIGANPTRSRKRAKFG